MFNFNKILKNEAFNINNLTNKELEEVYVKSKISKKLENDLKQQDIEAPIKKKIWQKFLQDLSNNGRLGLEIWFYKNGDEEVIKEVKKYKKGNMDFVGAFFKYLTDDDKDREVKLKAIRSWVEESLESNKQSITFALKQVVDRKSDGNYRRITF